MQLLYLQPYYYRKVTTLFIFLQLLILIIDLTHFCTISIWQQCIYKVQDPQWPVFSPVPFLIPQVIFLEICVHLLYSSTMVSGFIWFFIVPFPLGMFLAFASVDVCYFKCQINPLFFWWIYKEADSRPEDKQGLFLCYENHWISIYKIFSPVMPSYIWLTAAKVV